MDHWTSTWNWARLGLCGLMLLLVPDSFGQPKTQVDASTVVFVCEHGSAKSVIAAAHFNRLAIESGLPYRAVSRGTKADGSIPPAVLAGLRSDGIDISSWRPNAVKDEEIRDAMQIVSFATDLPATKAFAKSKLLEWNEIPSVSQNYEAARTAIVERLKKLIHDLLATRRNNSPLEEAGRRIRQLNTYGGPRYSLPA